MGAAVPSGTDEPKAPSAAESEVTSVVVHASGAVVTRRARVTVPTGTAETTVRVEGLPPTLYEQSLRGRVVNGPHGLRVTDVRLDVGATVHRGEQLPSLRLDLEDAEDQQSRLQDRKYRLESEIEEVAALRAEPPQPRRGDPPRWAPVESFLALAGFVDTRLGFLHERLRATEDQLARADHDVDVLRARLHQSSTALSAERTDPAVGAVVTLASEVTDATDVPDASADEPDAPETREDTSPNDEAWTPADAPAEIDVEVEVEYHVPGATWVPTYQLRLDGTSGAGTLVLRACVAQRTGEDWSGVRLALSTADLLRRSDLPELRSLRIGRAQQEPQTPGWREPPPGLAELFTGYDGAAAAHPAASRGPARPSGPGAPRSMNAWLGGVEDDLEEADLSPDLAAGGAYGPAEPGGAAEAVGYGGSFGGPVPAPGAAPPPAPLPAAAPMSQAHAEPATDRARGRSAPVARSARRKTAAPPVPPPSTAPSVDMLDYGRLTVAGPDAGAERGTLRPEAAPIATVVTEYRRRAETVGRLPRPAHAVDVRTSAGSFDYRFDTAAPADVVSDGAWHIVPVSEVPVVTESLHVCVPAVDTAVFGTVLVTNTSPHALLAGPADVMVDGDFVLTAALPTLAPGQRQAVGVGVAESVQVARRTHMRESTAGLRGGTTVLDHTVEIEVANRLPYPVVVEVRERVPVSTDKDVRIEEHRARPAWTEPEEPLTGQDGSYVRGARVWRVELAPGRTTTLTGGFEVRLPAGKSVVGGNRRK
ncbi:DUF4139 domain-containing protein [Streptomyces sp. NPDC008079]|uniref:DUF4139 domain-containing protein n=1 Tax=Streptomyces sp. NPDC008079 TaxID=3364806 RepID=UPI0036E115AB